MASALGAHRSWANTPNRTEPTEPGRQALLAKFEREVDPDGKLPPEERAKRAENARKAFYLELALKSAKARRLKKKAAEADAEARRARREAREMNRP